ncbi:MAG: NAD(P)-dependent oxidoreductase [Treponema sp.]|jgi:dTDP-glucose 4,6-dehydratase|nr:NAD(P)-dependent oxidoreductase [Treponema sp.]
MAVIIFGGGGFVGNWLTKALVQNNERIIICDIEGSPVHEQARFISCDIKNIDNFKQIPISSEDIVINLAANQYHHKPQRRNTQEYFFDANTQGTKNILDFLVSAGGRKFVQYTTDMIYGKPQYLPIDIHHPQIPFGPYGQSKKASEDICREYRKKGIDITIFRPRMIIGPGRLGILKKLFFLIHHNLPVPTIGSGKNCYQMASVFDCVSATIAAIQHGCPNKEYNLGSKNPPTERELLKNLIKKTGSHSPVIPTNGKMVKAMLSFLGAIGLEIMYREQYMIADEDYILDISETEQDLNWTPRYSDQDMIIEAYSDYISQLGENYEHK